MDDTRTEPERITIDPGALISALERRVAEQSVQIARLEAVVNTLTAQGVPVGPDSGNGESALSDDPRPAEGEASNG